MKQTIIIVFITIMIICSILVGPWHFNSMWNKRFNYVPFSLNIAIIGSSGYIGSRLLILLKGEKAGMSLVMIGYFQDKLFVRYQLKYFFVTI